MRAVAVFLVLAATFGAVLLDLRARARAAFLEAERLEGLALDPVRRAAVLEADFLREADAIERRRSSGRLSAAEASVALDVLRAGRGRALLRPPEAAAYHAYKDVYELYGPPETTISRRSRLKAAAWRQRWREAWKTKGLPHQESLLDLVPGEEEGLRWVYSTRDPREASRLLGALTGLGLPVVFRPPSPEERLGPDAGRFLVPEARFWDVNKALAGFIDKK